jgi:transcriptional regulator CtsR
MISSASRIDKLFQFKQKLLPQGRIEEGKRDEVAPKISAKKSNTNYIFLNRFSNACRASVGREGDGGGALTAEGCE